jgi:hypothetical protein
LQEDKRIGVDAGNALRGEKVKEDLFVINQTMCYALSCSGTTVLRRVIAEGGAIAAKQSHGRVPRVACSEVRPSVPVALWSFAQTR